MNPIGVRSTPEAGRGIGKGPLLSRLALRLTVVLLAVTLVGMAVMGLYVARALERDAVDTLRSGLVRSARLVEDALSMPSAPERAEDVQRLVERFGAALEARVTVIAADGTVLGDSERDATSVREMENHAARPEVRAAMAGGTGTDVRRSRTLNVDMLYVAIPLAGPTQPRGVVRLALPLTEIARTSASIRRTVQAGALLAITVALGVGLFTSRRVTKPVARMTAVARRMAEGDFGQRVPVTGRDEIAEFGDALNRMAQALRDKVQTLEAERAEMAAILEGMVEGVIALDDRGRILLMNSGARAIFQLADRPGSEPGEGRPLIEVIRQKTLSDLVERCRAGGPEERWQREVELGPPVNRILSAQAVRVPFASQGVGTVLVLHDVTELRRLEHVRAEFVANVSHELRTPLTSIQGYLETLLDGALDDPAHARRFLQTANTHARRLARLVDDLLQLANIEAGRIALHIERVGVREVTDVAVAMFERQIAEKRIHVLNQVSGDVQVQADRDRLVQILVNLVDNAVKYTADDGRVTIDAARRDGGNVEIAVSDTGVGIPSIDLPRITERFYRVDKARSRELGGTGLGLAIVKHLVQAQGGQIRIESELGKGTTVRVALPG